MLYIVSPPPQERNRARFERSILAGMTRTTPAFSGDFECLTVSAVNSAEEGQFFSVVPRSADLTSRASPGPLARGSRTARCRPADRRVRARQIHVPFRPDLCK